MKVESKCRRLDEMLKNELIQNVDLVIVDFVEKAGASVVDDVFSTWDWGNKNNDAVTWLIRFSGGHTEERKKMNGFMASKGYTGTWHMRMGKNKEGMINESEEPTIAI